MFDADEIIPGGESEDSTIMTFEKVVDLDRRVVSVRGGLAWVDDLDAIGSDIASTMNRKSFKMDVNFRKKTYFTRVYECQVGFIRGATSPHRESTGLAVRYFEVSPVTALHNVNAFNATDEKFKEALLVYGTGVDYKLDLEFDEGGIDVSKVVPPPFRDHENNLVFWNTVDLTWGRVIIGPTRLNDILYTMRESSNFEAVRDDFVFEVGQKVGIAVYSDTGATKKTASAPADVTDEMLREVFGEPRQTNIYTREIKYVGTHHLEYDINSFIGCSGAVVFLLDKKQPASVLESDWGCAIAVHAGAHTRCERNIAFKLSTKPRNDSILGEARAIQETSSI
jgi:hypothetical protein